MSMISRSFGTGVLEMKGSIVMMVLVLFLLFSGAMSQEEKIVTGMPEVLKGKK